MTETTKQSRRRLLEPGPALTLIFLAPFISEVLPGSTRLSYIIAFVPEMLVWGCGALLAREVVRRWRAGWPSLLFLGLALSMAEELIIQQTSLAPFPWAGVSATYARLWGVNWLYFLFMLVYESVMVVMVPIQVTELAFQDRQEIPWLTKWRIVRATWLFTVGSFMAYFGWVKRARTMYFHVAPYTPPLTTVAAGILAIASLVLFAYLLRRLGRDRRQARCIGPPWIVGLVTLVLGFPWYLILDAVFSPAFRPSFSYWWEIAAGALWAGLTFLLFRFWTSAIGWRNEHRWAASFAAMIVCIVAGFQGSSTWLKKDVAFKVMVDVGMMVWMASLHRRLEPDRRHQPSERT